MIQNSEHGMKNISLGIGHALQTKYGVMRVTRDDACKAKVGIQNFFK